MIKISWKNPIKQPRNLSCEIVQMMCAVSEKKDFYSTQNGHNSTVGLRPLELKKVKIMRFTLEKGWKPVGEWPSAFSLFPTMFLLLWKQNFNFGVYFVNCKCFPLGLAKILSFDKELSHYLTMHPSSVTEFGGRMVLGHTENLPIVKSFPGKKLNFLPQVVTWVPNFKIPAAQPRNIRAQLTEVRMD